TAGLVLGGGELVPPTITLTVAQAIMVAAKTAVERNDVKLTAKLAAKEARRRDM
ncbi:MAG: hypothetical protein H8D48_02625, partial [Actinobacteria bacterium]|nr:hypothetical protein [Actinomycetota bacterium]